MLQESFLLEGPPANPNNYTDQLRRLCTRTAFPRLARVLRKDEGGRLFRQDSGFAEYYPKLNTAKNGLTAFEWPVEDIKILVGAFGAPFAGASVLYKASTYFVRRCEVVERGRKDHPFCTGLIVDVTQNAVDITQNAVTLLGIKGVVGFSDFPDASGSSLSCRTFRVAADSTIRRKRS